MPIAQILVGERGVGTRNASIVQRDVEPAERVDGRGHDRADLFRIGDVRTNEHRFASQGVDRSDRRSALNVVEIGNDDLGTARGEGLSTGTADTRRATGDDRDLSFELPALDAFAHDVGPSIVITGSSVIIHTKASVSRKLCSSGATIVTYSGAATKASKSAAESNHWIVMPS